MQSSEKKYTLYLPELSSLDPLEIPVLVRQHHLARNPPGSERHLYRASLPRL